MSQIFKKKTTITEHGVGLREKSKFRFSILSTFLCDDIEHVHLFNYFGFWKHSHPKIMGIIYSSLYLLINLRTFQIDLFVSRLACFTSYVCRSPSFKSLMDYLVNKYLHRILIKPLSPPGNPHSAIVCRIKCIECCV